MRTTRTPNEEGEAIGAVNVVFSKVYRVRVLGKRLKAWHRPSYYAVKFGLIAGLLWLFLA